LVLHALDDGTNCWVCTSDVSL